MRVMTAGIYRIRNRRTGEVYIGSSVNIAQRINSHVAGLRTGRHTNTALGAAGVQFGLSGFCFSILEETSADEDVLIEAETRWIAWARAAGLRLYNRGSVLTRRRGPIQRAVIVQEGARPWGLDLVAGLQEQARKLTNAGHDVEAAQIARAADHLAGEIAARLSYAKHAS